MVTQQNKKRKKQERKGGREWIKINTKEVPVSLLKRI